MVVVEPEQTGIERVKLTETRDSPATFGHDGTDLSGGTLEKRFGCGSVWEGEGLESVTAVEKGTVESCWRRHHGQTARGGKVFAGMNGINGDNGWTFTGDYWYASCTCAYGRDFTQAS